LEAELAGWWVEPVFVAVKLEASAVEFAEAELGLEPEKV